MKTFTAEELKEYDGSDPDKPLYIAFRGKVYDVTDNPLFTDGMHFEHPAGGDLSDDIEDAPHEDDVLDHLTIVGDFKG